MWCALAQITINKGQGMLAQITRNNFFYKKDKDKNLVCANTNHKKEFFSMEGQEQKYGVCWHKSQKQRTRCGNEY